MVVVKEIEENGETMAAAVGSGTSSSNCPKSKDGVQQTSDQSDSKPVSSSTDKVHQTQEVPCLSGKEDSSTDEHSKTKLGHTPGVAGPKSDITKMATTGKKQLKSVSMQQAEESTSKSKVNSSTFQRTKKDLKSVNMQQFDSSSSKGKGNPDTSYKVKQDLKPVTMQQPDLPSSKVKVVNPDTCTSQKVKQDLKPVTMQPPDLPGSKVKVNPDTSHKLKQDLKPVTVQQPDLHNSKGKGNLDTSQKVKQDLKPVTDLPSSKGKVNPDTSHDLKTDVKSVSVQQHGSPSSKVKVNPDASHKVKQDMKAVAMQQPASPSSKVNVNPDTSHKVKTDLKSVSLQQHDTHGSKYKVNPNAPSKSSKVQKELKAVSMQQLDSPSKDKMNPNKPKVKRDLKTVNLNALEISDSTGKDKVNADVSHGVNKSVINPQLHIRTSKEMGNSCMSENGVMSDSSSKQSAVAVTGTTKETNKQEKQKAGSDIPETASTEVRENKTKTKHKAKKSSKANNKAELEKKISQDQNAEPSSLDAKKSPSLPSFVDVSMTERSDETVGICSGNVENTASGSACGSSLVKEASENMDMASSNQCASQGTENMKESVDAKVCTSKAIPVVNFETLGEPSQSMPEEVKSQPIPDQVTSEPIPEEVTSTSAGKMTEQLRPVFFSKHWIKNVKERLKKAEIEDEVMLEFSQCKTDTERFACLYMQPAVHQVIHVEDWNKEKSEVQARVLRTTGNKSYQRKQFKEALEMYTESILKAPVESDSSELALAFANRSAVFYHLKMYVLCLQDIHFALKYGYPEHNRYKLYERKGKCSYHLKMKEEAISAFEQAIELAEKAKLSDLKIDRLVHDLEKELDQVEKINVSCAEIPSVNTFNNNHGPIPYVQGKKSYQFPCMSSSVVLKYTEERGRGLFAERDIEVGEVLIVEKPYSSVLLKGYEMNHCHHCCNSLLAPLPCHHCSGVAFCSEECQQKAWELYHYAECKYLVLIEKADIGMSHLALRMVLQAGFNNIKQYEQNNKETIYPLLKGCNEDGIYDSSDYHTVFNLEGHSKDRSVTDLLQRTLTAIFLVKCLRKTSYFPPISAEESEGDFGKDEDEDHALIGSHILRHIQMLPCNAHEVSELEWNSSDFELSEICEFGSAIYPVLSLINHSCDPSVVRHSYGNVCVVRAIRNIYKHEELLDSYGALYATTKRSQRQEKLLSQYYFQCECIACRNDWPEYADIPQENPVLKCKKCFGPIFIPSDGKNERAMCSACREVHDITHDLLHLSRSEELYQDALEKTLKGKDLEQCLPVLLKHLHLLDPLLCRPWRDYNNCQEAIKQCYSTMANCIKGKNY